MAGGPERHLSVIFLEYVYITRFYQNQFCQLLLHVNFCLPESTNPFTRYMLAGWHLDTVKFLSTTKARPDSLCFQ